MLALLIALFAPPPRCPSVCDCMAAGEVRQALNSSDAVFVARAIEERDTTRTIADREPSGSLQWPSRALTFVITKRWKGSIRDTVIVVTGYGGGDCGYPFKVGSTYLIYATAADDSQPPMALLTGICGRTAFIEAAAADIAELDRIGGAKR